MKNNIYDIQKKPEYSKKVSDSLFEYLAQSTGMPIQATQMVTDVVTSVVTGVLGVGETAIKANMEKNIKNFNILSQMYGFTFGSLLQFLEKNKLIATEQKGITYDFYKVFCADLPVEEKMEALDMMQTHDFKMRLLDACEDCILGAMGLASVLFGAWLLGYGKRK